MTPIRMTEDLAQIRVEEHLSPIRQLDVRDPGMLVKEFLEISQSHEPGANRPGDGARGCRARRAFELARGGQIQSHATWPYICAVVKDLTRVVREAA